MRRLLALLPPLLAAAGLPAQDAGPVEVRLFGDVGYLETETDEPGGFRIGSLAGHLAAALSDRFSFFGEVSLTPRATGYVLEAERVVGRYDHSDLLKLSAGRYHTPIGYWNTAFHHGRWLHTSISRPSMLRFGGPLLPIHFVGAMLEGTLPAGTASASYALGLGNGRGASPSRAGDAGDANDHRALTASGALSLPALGGLRAGGGWYRDRVGVPALDERIVSAFVVRERENPEVLLEWVRIRHEPLAAGPATSSEGWYGQVGYRLPGAAAAFKPYLRVEEVDVPAADPLFGAAGLDYAGIVAGLRVDAFPTGAVKLEVRSERIGAAERATSFAAQFSFTLATRHGGEAPVLHPTAHPPGSDR
jgi:hypothetical protein